MNKLNYLEQIKQFNQSIKKIKTFSNLYHAFTYFVLIPIMSFLAGGIIGFILGVLYSSGYVILTYLAYSKIKKLFDQ